MPVEFLTTDQEERYGRFSGDPSPDQLARYFHLDEDDLAFVRGDLGRAVQLGTVRFLGTFITDPGEVPATAVRYIAQQLAVEEPLAVLGKYRRSQLRWIHAREIRERYGYRDLGGVEAFRLLRWLYARAWGSVTRPSVLFDLSTARLVESKVLLPGVTTLARLVARVRDRAAARVWQRLSQIPDPEQRARLDGLLVIGEGEYQSDLDRLRRPPTKISTPGLVGALHRLRNVRDLGVGHHDLSRIHPGRLAALARFAATARTQAIARMPDDRRIATLMAFAQSIEVRACDDAMDLLELLVRKTRAKAEKKEGKERLRTLRDLDAAALKLASACRLLVDPDTDVARASLFEQFPREQIIAAVDAVVAIARPPEEDGDHAHAVKHYKTIRGFLSLLMETITFEGTETPTALLEAWNGLRALGIKNGGPLKEDQVVMAAVPQAWRRYVLPSPGEVDRRAYTMCLVEQLFRALHRREVFVRGSKRWGDTRPGRPGRLLSRGSHRSGLAQLRHPARRVMGSLKYGAPSAPRSPGPAGSASSARPPSPSSDLACCDARAIFARPAGPSVAASRERSHSR